MSDEPRNTLRESSARIQKGIVLFYFWGRMIRALLMLFCELGLLIVFCYLADDFLRGLERSIEETHRFMRRFPVSSHMRSGSCFLRGSKKRESPTSSACCHAARKKAGKNRGTAPHGGNMLAKDTRNSNPGPDTRNRAFPAVGKRSSARLPAEGSA